MSAKTVAMIEKVSTHLTIVLTVDCNTLKRRKKMSDPNETLLNYYEEALDMGMDVDDAKEWAWDKLYGWRLEGWDK